MEVTMLTIDDPELERVIQDEAERTGQPPIEALRRIVREARPAARPTPTRVSEEERASRLTFIREMQERVAKLPVLDPRPMDELLGYDENGLPT
jgi:antitoxin VapB